MNKKGNCQLLECIVVVGNLLGFFYCTCWPAVSFSVKWSVMSCYSLTSKEATNELKQADVPDPASAHQCLSKVQNRGRY